MKTKSKSIIASLFIVVIILIFSTLSIVSIATPNLSKEVKKDLTEGVQSLEHGDIKNYYNMYNTRKLTEIGKTKFYEKIRECQDILKSEKDLFEKYRLSIKINDVSIINKIGDNLFLCNINVNYKYRKHHSTTTTIDKTEDFIVKIIDVGEMEYKILLPFNSLDKDFSSSNIYNKLKESHAQKQAEKIKQERESKEENDNTSTLESTNDLPTEDNIHNAQVLDIPSNTEANNNDNNTNKEDDNTEEENTVEDNSNTNNESTSTTNNTQSSINLTTDSDKTSYESFFED